MKDGYLVSLRSWQPRTIANPNPPIYVPTHTRLAERAGRDWY